MTLIKRKNRIKQDTRPYNYKKTYYINDRQWRGGEGEGRGGEQCLGRKTLGIRYIFYSSQDNIFVVRIINRRITI